MRVTRESPCLETSRVWPRCSCTRNAIVQLKLLPICTLKKTRSSADIGMVRRRYLVGTVEALDEAVAAHLKHVTASKRRPPP